MLVILALLALVPSVGLARVERKGAVACQVKAAPTCCCPKENSLSGNCCCKATKTSSCDLGAAPCSADENASPVVLAHVRAKVPARFLVSLPSADFQAAPSVLRESVRALAVDPTTPPPKSFLAG